MSSFRGLWPPQCHLNRHFQALWLFPAILHSRTAGKPHVVGRCSPFSAGIRGVGGCSGALPGSLQHPQSLVHGLSLPVTEACLEVLRQPSSIGKGRGDVLVWEPRGHEGLPHVSSGMCPEITWGFFPRWWGELCLAVALRTVPSLGLGFPVTHREQSCSHGGDDRMERTRPWGIPALPLPALTPGIVS